MNLTGIIPEKVLEDVKNLLSVPRKIVVTTHKNPDGDAMGSAIGFTLFLQNLGHDACAVVPNEYPEFLQWLPGNENVIRFSETKSLGIQKLEEADVIFCVDFNDTGRLSNMEEDFLKLKKTVVIIDHHPEPKPFADYTISFTGVSSTAELIFYFISTIGEEKHINKSIAECLFTGILTDTGSFSYSSSNPGTFNAASELLKFGINKDQIHGNIFDNYSADRMRFLGYCMNEKMVVLKEYNTAYMCLTAEEQKRFNFVIGDDEGFVNVPLSIKGVKFSAYFIEKHKHIKISFRSRGGFNVNLFSRKHFNGGGHINAAGGKMEISLQETCEQFLKILPLYKDQLQ
jgi:phosphoesterase RecJ-like protein